MPGVELGCPNPDCPALEIEEWGGEIEDVHVQVWEARQAPATLIDPPYISGGADCPECGFEGLDPDRAEEEVRSELQRQRDAVVRWYMEKHDLVIDPCPLPRRSAAA